MASQEGHVDVVRVLLSKGANQQVTTEVRFVAYFFVCYQNFDNHNIYCMMIEGPQTSPG